MYVAVDDWLVRVSSSQRQSSIQGVFSSPPPQPPRCESVSHASGLIIKMKIRLKLYIWKADLSTGRLGVFGRKLQNFRVMESIVRTCPNSSSGLQEV